MSDPVYIGYYTLDNALSMPNDARFIMYIPGFGSYNITGALLKSQILTNPAITGGTINGTAIGGTTPAVGTFTTLAATSRISTDRTLTAKGVDAASTDVLVSSVTIGRHQANSMGWIQAYGSTSSEPLQINPIGGPVLVGTTTNDGVNKLQVNGSISSSGIISGAHLRVTNTNGITLSDNAVGGFLSYGYNSGRTNAAYHVWYNGISSELMRLTSSGNLLVKNPVDDGVNALQVNGNGKFTGNLTLDGYARRIIADFDNDTISNRAVFQTSTANRGTYIGAIPNGTSTTSLYRAFTSSDPDNSGFVNMFTGSTSVGLISSRFGTGTTLPLTFGIGNTAVNHHMLTTSGNTVLKTGVVAGDDDGVNKLQVDGPIKCTQFKLSAMNTAPAFPGDTGTTGEIRITGSHIYVCTATNNWVRAALSVW